MALHGADPSAGAHLPVTVVVSRRPVPGHEADLLEWAHGIVAAASAFPGHVAAQVYPSAPPDRDDVVIAFTFADAHTLSGWEHSDARREWLEQAAPLTTGAARTHAVTGFESLFATRTTRPATPPRWKTATVIGLALFPASLLLNWLLVPHLASWNVALRVLTTTLIIVPFMVWAGVPWLSRWLAPWLARPGTRP